MHFTTMRFILYLLSFSAVFSHYTYAQKEVIDAIIPDQRIGTEELIDIAEIHDLEEPIADTSIEETLEARWPVKDPLEFNLGNINGHVHVRWKPESFYGRNIHLLNNNVDADEIYFSRSTIDVDLHLGYGKEFFGYNAAEFYWDLRHKVIWGDPGTSAITNKQSIKFLDFVGFEHDHTISVQFPRIREIWMAFSIPDALGLSFKNNHFLKLGSFPFELGRGISLGNAFAVNPGFLGFYSDNTVDQFAYGFLFYGEFIQKILSYDLYGAILENLSDSFRNTTAKVRGQEFGRKRNPQRGAGEVDYIIASRLTWIPVYDEAECKNVHIEPYFFFNNAPEQKVEVPADAESKLATFGLAAEFAIHNFECGFDMAFNTGYQKVRGLDRNIVKAENRGGVATFINSRVHIGSPDGALVTFDPKTPNGALIQSLIENSPESSIFNGKAIGTVNGVELFNGQFRFRDPYTNDFKGKMFIADGSYKICDVKISGMIGVATGDEDPNVDLHDPNDTRVDGDYKGFISVQEIYTGDRVESVFLLGGAGRAPRPLSSPSQDTVLDEMPSTISNFTNLIILGTSIDYQPTCFDRYIRIRPNLLFYWQEHATKKFDKATRKSSEELASKFLGTEVNLFFDGQLMPDLVSFFRGSVFIPGSHYRDIRCKPLNPEQRKHLDKADKTGVQLDRLPLLGDDIAWTISLGLQARF